MELCKTCKYFVRNTSDYNQEDFGECVNSKLAEGMTDKRSSFDSDMLLYSSSESEGAYLEVGESFGCIHHEYGEHESEEYNEEYEQCSEWEDDDDYDEYL